MRFPECLFKPEGQHRPTKEGVMLSLTPFFESNPDVLIERKAIPLECNVNDLTIYGEYCMNEPSKGCVIMAHGYGQNRYILLPQEKIFREMGFTTIIFDQRGFGESNSSYTSFGVSEATDVVRLIYWAREQFGKDIPVILFGVSMGAATVLNTVKYDQSMDFIIADSSFSTFEGTVTSLYRGLGFGEPHDGLFLEVETYSKRLGFSNHENQPMLAARNSKIPICILHGSVDKTIDLNHAKKIYNVLKNLSSMIEVFEGREHALCVMDTLKYASVLSVFLQELIGEKKCLK